ncbi:MAG: polysaccharide deacetylase family protein [Anaerolineales bacterium]
MAACAPQSGAAPTHTITPTPFTNQSPATSQSSEPTATPNTAAAPTTDPLPAGFTSDIIRPGIEPVAYITDGCQYLQMRWDPAGALPGTVVAPIMFHSILEGNTEPNSDSAINEAMFAAIIRLAEDLGFETITTQQLLDFLRGNAKIPARSMILILDDRKPGTAEDIFLPVLEEQGWTATLAWIAQSDTDRRSGRLAGESMWDWIERLNDTGYFDIQSHGRDHIYITESTSEEATRQEIAGSIPILKEHFGSTPIAYIWPGGNFTDSAIQVAHEAGFELGFIERSYGPLLFNWVPLSERERAFGDPLLLLPRFWDTAALLNLEQTAQIGDAAQEFAKENYAAEAAWFSQNCGGKLPDLEDVFK